MALRTIITAPDPRLKLVSDPLSEVDDSTRRLMDDMLETMYEAPGIGLAAVQIGVPKRVIVMDLAKEKDGEPHKPMFFVNPKLIWAFGWAALGSMLITQMRVLQDVFATTPLTGRQWALCLLPGVILLALGELGKLVLRARRPHRPPVVLPRQRTPEPGRVAQTG